MNDNTSAKAKTPAFARHGIDARPALIVGVLCWAGFGVIAWAISRGWLARFDAAGMVLLRVPGGQTLIGPPVFTEAMRDITALGAPAVRWLIVSAVAGGLLFIHLRRETAILIAAMFTGLLIQTTLKGLFARPRPDLVPHLTQAGGFSFPSGHAFNSALVLIGCALAIAALNRRKSVRLTLIGGAFILSMLVALSRVALGVHYPSDVIAGWLGGVGWAFIAAGLSKLPTTAANGI